MPNSEASFRSTHSLSTAKSTHLLSRLPPLNLSYGKVFSVQLQAKKSQKAKGVGGRQTAQMQKQRAHSSKGIKVHSLQAQFTVSGLQKEQSPKTAHELNMVHKTANSGLLTLAREEKAILTLQAITEKMILTRQGNNAACFSKDH
eukprot:1144002-Pelagomonas_calceolata.AAC.2